jgi:hypothetical protein
MQSLLRLNEQYFSGLILFNRRPMIMCLIFSSISNPKYTSHQKKYLQLILVKLNSYLSMKNSSQIDKQILHHCISQNIGIIFVIRVLSSKENSLIKKQNDSEAS